MLRENSNCYVAGFGLNGHSPEDKLKFIQVTLVPPQKCTEFFSGDFFLSNMKADKHGNYPIICALGHEDTKQQKHSNTCGGDSGFFIFFF